MSKIIGMFSVCVLMITMLAVLVAAPAPVDFCSDSDSGSNIWIGGTVTTNNGPNTIYKVDDCDGASENLMEFYCDGNQWKLDNIKCSDFGAICITVGDKTVADYCAMPTCGDGVKSGDEECDAGSSNGQGCSPLCEQRCNYCDSDCTIKTNYNPTSCGGGPPPVPEFSTWTLGLAIIGVGLGLALLRKK